MKNYHIFISHAWRYNDDYYKIVQWLNEAKSAKRLNWSNFSVPEHDPFISPTSHFGKNTLKGLLDKQINPASVVIIIAGMYAAHSEWIDYEIEKAMSLNKYIIGMRPRGQERVPLKISNNANVMVNWNKESLLSLFD